MIDLHLSALAKVEIFIRCWFDGYEIMNVLEKIYEKTIASVTKSAILKLIFGSGRWCRDGKRSSSGKGWKE